MSRGALIVAIVALLAIVAGRGILRAPESRGVHTWREPVTGMELVLVPPGTFRAGTPATEPGREPQEVQHGVTLTKAFYLGAREVTQAQWTAVMHSNPSHFNGCAACPVETVTFYDVQSFMAHLNEFGGPGFRLPTEAEWERACRAGGSDAFGTASTLGSDDANIDGNYPYNAPKGTSREQTMPAGSFRANAWGFFDLSGNVWEWTADEHCPYPATDATDPVGRCSSELRVIRGGSWKFDGNSARCGLRYTHRPQDSGPSLGFRVARDASAIVKTRNP